MTAPNPAPPTAPEPRPRRTLLGFLFQTTLGCSSFALGSLVVLLLLLPTLVSGTVARSVESGFAERHQGRLTIGSVSLAWFQSQSLRDVRLQDPDGRDVARASATLPSLLTLVKARSGRVGAVTVEVEADLVADDAGVTNLQRALEPRGTSARDEAAGSEIEASTTFDVSDFVASLDLDLRVDVKRLAWSDARTRSLGRPFEITGGVVQVRAQPGSPLVALVQGRIAGQEAGTIEIHAQVDGPVDPSARWPLGRTQANGRVEGFSTALVDGLAGLSGDLVEVLGPAFSLRFDARAESAERATLDLSLDGAQSRVALDARLADGVITAREEPFLVATAPFPRAILERLARPHLPPDARLTLADAGKPWSVRVPRLRVPVPGPEARDLKSLRPALDAAEIDLELDLPGSVAIETDALRAARRTAGLSAIRLSARAAPGRPLVARLDAALDAGAPGGVRVDATLPDAFGLLAGAHLAPADVNAVVTGLSTLALGEIAGQGTRLESALGPVARLAIEARGANLEGGDLRLEIRSDALAADVGARIAGGALTIDDAGPARIAWTPPPAFVAAEIGARLPPECVLRLDGPVDVAIGALSAPVRDAATGCFAGVDVLLAGLAAQLEVSLPDATWTSPQTRAAQVTAALRGARVALQVAAGAAPGARVTGDVLLGDAVSGPGARLEVDVRPRGNLAALSAGGTPACAVDFALRGLDVAALEALAGQSGGIAPLVGPRLDLVGRTDGTLPSAGTLDVSLAGADGRVELRGSIADGRFSAAGDAGLSATLLLTNEFLRARLGAPLPPGTRVEIAGADRGAVTVSLRDLATPIDAPDLARRLAATNARLEVALPRIAYADAATEAAGRSVVLGDARFSGVLAPSAASGVRFSARIEDAPPGEIAVDLQALDPLERLADEAARRTFRVATTVKASDVPTALVDALAGQGGLLVEALGPRLLLDVKASDVSLQRGAFDARCESGRNRVVFAGRVDDGVLVVDSVDGLDADVALGPLVMDRVVGRLLPILREASFLAPVAKQDLVTSAEFAPFVLKSDDLRFALGSDLSKLNGRFHVDLGKLTFRGLPLLDQLGFALDAGEVRLPAFTVPIQDGVATYRKLPIRLGGRDVLFDGTVRLVDGEMALAAELPLSLFGKKFDKELGPLRDYIPPGTAIPIELRGTWNKPRVGFREGFLQGLIESAATKAGGKKLDELLDGLLGGKKKKPKKDG